MIRAIRSDRVPNLIVLQYSTEWLIKNLLLIPRVFFSESVIEKRPPLGPAARRAGWVGCNILLDRIPRDGKISLVASGSVVAEQYVREEFSRIRKLAEIPPSVRGWTLDVLAAVRRLAKPRFSLQELYELTLSAEHSSAQSKCATENPTAATGPSGPGFDRVHEPGSYAVRA